MVRPCTTLQYTLRRRRLFSCVQCVYDGIDRKSFDRIDHDLTGNLEAETIGVGPIENGAAEEARLEEVNLYLVKRAEVDLRETLQGWDKLSDLVRGSECLWSVKRWKRREGC